MKRTIVIMILLLIVMSITSCYAIVKYLERNTIDQYNKTMKIANEKFCITNMKIEDEENIETKEIIGVLEIKKLNIKAPVKNGTTSEILKYSIGHFVESDMWDGNIALASHNRGSYAHYFENIDKLENGDEIKYTTNNGMRIYDVIEQVKIEETNWEKVLENKEYNTLTLVTCITGQKDYRLCIKAIERKEN